MPMRNYPVFFLLEENMTENKYSLATYVIRTTHPVMVLMEPWTDKNKRLRCILSWMKAASFMQCGPRHLRWTYLNRPVLTRLDGPHSCGKRARYTRAESNTIIDRERRQKRDPSSWSCIGLVWWWRGKIETEPAKERERDAPRIRCGIRLPNI